MGRVYKAIVALGGHGALVLAVSLGTAVQAELFSGFYKSTQPAITQDQANQYQLGHDAVCLAAILEAQTRYGIPDNLLLSIGIQEAGKLGNRGLTVWPWSVNAEGTGAFFPTRESMLRWVRNQMNLGVESIDVGCMQINQKWHGHACQSLEQATDPRVNVDYAARYLSDLFRSEGDWWSAAGRYHSSNEKFKSSYLEKLERNQKIANTNIEQLVNLIVEQTSLAPIELSQAVPKKMPSQFWGTDKSDTTPGTFTIYSHTPMQPIIPNYKELN